MDTEERAKAEAYAREQPNRARSLAVKAYVEEHAALLAEVERLRSASAPAGTPSEAAYQAAYDAFCRATGEHDQDEGIAAALAAAYAVDGRASGAPAGSAPEPALWVLRRIIEELPSKRDWLDPDLESAAWALLRGAAPTASAAAAEPRWRYGVPCPTCGMTVHKPTTRPPLVIDEDDVRGAASQRQDGT